MSDGTVTLKELVEYVLKNRKGNAFKDYNEHTIASCILRGTQEEYKPCEEGV